MKNRSLKIMLLGTALLSSFSFADIRSFRPKIRVVAEIDGVDIGISDSYISLEKAKEIALRHAGVSRNKAQKMKGYLDWENGRRIYDIEFYNNNVKYEYEIDAATGKIINYSRKDRNVNNSTNSGYINESQARRIALSRVRGANNSHIKKFKLDREDGRMVYEGEIEYNGREYEFDIDAVTGEFIRWDVD